MIFINCPPLPMYRCDVNIKKSHPEIGFDILSAVLIYLAPIAETSLTELS
jgi:hypothetical protein